MRTTAPIIINTLRSVNHAEFVIFTIAMLGSTLASLRVASLRHPRGSHRCHHAGEVSIVSGAVSQDETLRWSQIPPLPLPPSPRWQNTGRMWEKYAEIRILYIAELIKTEPVCELQNSDIEKMQRLSVQLPACESANAAQVSVRPAIAFS